MEPTRILDSCLAHAQKHVTKPIILDKKVLAKIEFVCRCPSNRAGVRLLLSCLLAKVHQPKLDPRKPYTEIGGADSFSGRTYDERYITHFINKYQLPCNPTTAFLTPALRNMDKPLTTRVDIVGRPREVYAYTLELLHDVHSGTLSAEDMLTEAIRQLMLFKEEKKKRMVTLIDGLKRGAGALPLSSEAIIRLMEQHLACKNSSRLPVLIVAAAYASASTLLGKVAKPLNAHNAADLQTNAVGDVEVCFVGDSKSVIAYEMKMKSVTVDDIDAALQKIAKVKPKILDYVFITTEKIDEAVAEYAATFYEETGGTEIVMLDCIGFLRHFLHLFHELRIDFLDSYQELVLAEPESAISQPLKEAFLALRQAAESDE